MPSESVKIETDILQKVRLLARKESRTLSAQLRLLLERALTSKKGE